MKISRYREPSGLILTHFGGRHTYDDAINALEELNQMTEGSSVIYEIVVHDDDIKIEVSEEQITSLRGKVRRAFLKYTKGALAFVANSDFVFGLCRQLELMMDNANIVVSVFRSEELARRWIKEIQSIQERQE